MPSFYPEGNEPRQSDDEMRSAHKLLSAGIGVTGSSATLSGLGPPGAGLGFDGSTYFDKTNKDFYVKDNATWTLLVDLI